MGLFRTVSEINGDFSPKSQSFPTPCIFRLLPPLKRLPLILGIGARAPKTRMMGLATGPNPGFKLASRISQKTVRQGQSYYRTVIGNYALSIEWYHFQ